MAQGNVKGVECFRIAFLFVKNPPKRVMQMRPVWRARHIRAP